MIPDKYERMIIDEGRRYKPRILAYLNNHPDKADYAQDIVKVFFVKASTSDYHEIAGYVSYAIHELREEGRIYLDHDLKERIRE